MILADKIIYLRKKFGMTQEELASQMEVSRQSVSKWESTMAMPDINKIIKLSEVFGVSTDFLLNENLGAEDIESNNLKDEFLGKIIEIKDANEYLFDNKEFAKKIALGVFLFILAPALMVFFLALPDEKFELIGIVVLLLTIAVGVGICIVGAMKISKYDYMEKEEYDFAYGVKGMIKKEEENYQERHIKFIVTGVGLLILCCLPIIIGQILYPNMKESTEIMLVGILLLIVAFGASILTYTEIRKDAYGKIIKNSDIKVLEKNKKKDKISGIYWTLVLAIYLTYSFISFNWYISWVIWPIAGILSLIIDAFFD